MPILTALKPRVLLFRTLLIQGSHYSTLLLIVLTYRWMVSSMTASTGRTSTAAVGVYARVVGSLSVTVCGSVITLISCMVYHAWHMM